MHIKVAGRLINVGSYDYIVSDYIGGTPEQWRIKFMKDYSEHNVWSFLTEADMLAAKAEIEAVVSPVSIGDNNYFSIL